MSAGGSAEQEGESGCCYSELLARLQVEKRTVQEGQGQEGKEEVDLFWLMCNFLLKIKFFV